MANPNQPQQQNQNQQAPNVQTSSLSRNVIVGCKLPNGIKLSITTPRGEETIVLKGNAFYRQPNPDRKFENPTLLGADGASVTIISREFWEEFLRQHPDYKPYTSGAIYVAADRASIEDMSKDHKEIETGLEQLDPKKHGVTDLGKDPILH